MPSASVKRFNHPKGFGFIAAEDGPDAFDHHAVIDVTGCRSLREGDQIPFAIVESTQGPAAHNTTIV